MAWLAVVIVAASIAAHHTPLGAGADAHHAIEAGAIAEFCLAVVTVVGVVATAVAFGTWDAPRRDGTLVGALVASVAAIAAPSPRSRAGPARLSLLCVIRR
jgi:hypothetical protein